MDEPLMSEDEQDELIANVELVGRSGGKSFKIEHSAEPEPTPLGAMMHTWTASAFYQGARLFSPGKHFTPISAVQALAKKILTGAMCRGCTKLIALSADGAMWFPGQRNPDGSEFTQEQAEERGQCLWQREGKKWQRGCGDDAPAGSTRAKLAKALVGVHAPAAMIRVAREGGYDEYLSELPFPLIQLVSDLTAIGAHELALRVKNGDFDATAAEGDTWAKSAEGKAAFAELLGREPTSAYPNRAARRRAGQDKKRRR